MPDLGSTDLPKALIFNVIVEEGREGLLYARSPELPGLLVAEKTRDALLEEIPKVIKAMLQESGKEMAIYEAERPRESETLAPAPWVAIPAHIADIAARS